MATIILSAAGQVIGGPVGGTIGALVGNQIDQLIFKPKGREGARLKELQVTTSSYGTPIARHFGTIRAPGSVIWATDLVENKEKQGGGKGKPSVTTFTYSASFAVALASRPIRNIGRIWADGNLLRGEAGDLKAGGELRIHLGHGDQLPDPLIASAEGARTPAFRGLAYCVFESLQLADFGNRIPSLSFEVIADHGEISLAEMMPLSGVQGQVDRPLSQLVGFSDEGGSIAANLETIGQVYPISCDASGNALTIRASDTIPVDPPLLPQAVTDSAGDGFGAASGQSQRRQADLREVPGGLRYYDLSRDFQPGLQRADGRARPGRNRVIEFPGSLRADDARKLANGAAMRAAWEKEQLSWRIAELDPALAPGDVVRVPGKAGLWQIQTWELRETGVELDLRRLPHTPSRSTTGDAGTALAPTDLPTPPTILQAYELPWDGVGSPSQRQIFTAASSVGPGWKGAALYAVANGGMTPIGSSGKTRATMGNLASDLAPGQSALFNRLDSCEVALVGEDMTLETVGLDLLLDGANRALIAGEIIQFAAAERIDGARWRITGLLRGLGGTEVAALASHPAGAAFVLLDDAPIAIDVAAIAGATQIAAAGLADADPVISPIANPGNTLKPLQPVHPVISWKADGGLLLCWKRRSRGTWQWLDHVDVPLNEEFERYRVGIGSTNQPERVWEVAEAMLDFSPADIADLQANHAGQPVWVRQIGSYAASDPLLLHTI